MTAITEELRAAATKLRETAVLPLETIAPLFEGQPDEWTKYYGMEQPDLPTSDIPWIVLMTPELATPLAAWLDWGARQAEMNVTLAPRHRLNLDEALAVARVINGGAS